MSTQSHYHIVIIMYHIYHLNSSLPFSFFLCLSLQLWTRPPLRALCVPSPWIRVIHVWTLPRRVTWMRCVSVSAQPTSLRVAALLPSCSHPSRAAVNGATGHCGSFLSECRMISATHCSSAHAGTKRALSDDARPSYPPALLRKRRNQTASSSEGSADQMHSAGMDYKQVKAKELDVDEAGAVKIDQCEAAVI